MPKEEFNPPANPPSFASGANETQTVIPNWWVTTVNQLKTIEELQPLTEPPSLDFQVIIQDPSTGNVYSCSVGLLLSAQI